MITAIINKDNEDIDGRPFGEREYPGGDEEARSAWKSCFQAVTAPLQACDPPVPWTYCPGNHDDDGTHPEWCREDLREIFRLPCCATPGATRGFDFTFRVRLRATGVEGGDWVRRRPGGVRRL